MGRKPDRGRQDRLENSDVRRTRQVCKEVWSTDTGLREVSDVPDTKCVSGWLAGTAQVSINKYFLKIYKTDLSFKLKYIEMLD